VSICRHISSTVGLAMSEATFSLRSPVQTQSGSRDARIERIVERIRAIPEGFVRTYGDIDPVAPRFVGLVLSQTDEDLPWQRVVRADGSLAKGDVQRRLLLREGVPMRGDRVDLKEARLPPELESLRAM
jgi:methylated-DNA-protein-cysteine methyltransferase-like protein